MAAPKREVYLGVDIGGTKILCELVTAAGRVLERRKVKVPPRASAPGLFKILTSLIDETLATVPGASSKLKGIGVGVPGIVEPKTERIVAAPNIGLTGFPLAGRLRKRYGLPVALGNDANLAVLAEQWLGAAKGKRNVVALFPGTGVGGGVIIDGNILTGTHGAAAELGHILIREDGPLCGCGKRGCLEASVGRRSIERKIRGKRRSTGKKAIGSGKLSKALDRNDPVVKKYMKNAAKRLGTACVSLRQVFDPDLFVLGGGMVEACGWFILPIVRKTVNKDPFFAKVSSCPVLAAKLGDDAVAVGGAALVRAMIQRLKA